MNMKFMISHPLRETLTSEDWDRIQIAWDGGSSFDSITQEEWDAASDAMFDAIAANAQTHLGVYVLQ
jgi:hypothetical protein